MSRKALLALYSLTHLWVDLSCAFLLFRTCGASARWGLCLLLYNFCAFALQMPLGLLADALNRNALLAALGCLLTALAFFSPAPVLTAAAAGVGNALFHLGGGLDTLNDSTRQAAALGIFVSPGALGLFWGTAWGKGDAVPLYFPPLLLFFAAAILWAGWRSFGSLRSQNAPVDLKCTGRPLALVPLFLVVVLRSYMGMNQSFPWKEQGAWALFLTLALVTGKCAGGFLADRITPRGASALSLGLAAALYLLSMRPLPGTAAVFLFNMTMPITLWAVARLLPGAKGFAFGLLTFALFLGVVPSFLGWPALLTSPLSYGAAALVSLLLLWWGLERRGTRC